LGGDTLEKQGKYKETEDMYQEQVGFYSKTLCDDHPYALATRHNLALVL